VEQVRVTAAEDDNSYNAEVYFHVIGIKEMQKLGVVLSRLR